MQVKTKRAATGRRAGNDTAARIVLAARELLMTEGYAQFSMRNCALALRDLFNNFDSLSQEAP